jgi:hypothetical protein
MPGEATIVKALKQQDDISQSIVDSQNNLE